ncbi:MAG TPA: ATP-binding protein [Anaerolineae bacterium]|nr:ATP-binding protein [Anaerolineae bacterium]HOQ98645.1 ATP-binding protein [Anaerolineae bacterium]HPL28259.1 ATP-binding protein [Anaerolineae bacterium]
MKQWVVLSGKGGTGKTTVAAALAHLASQERRLVMADADVDAANLELLLAPIIQEAHEFSGGMVAAIDASRCTGCGACRVACRFDAIVQDGDVCRVAAIACEGCAACSYVCPAGAVTMSDRPNGQWFRSETALGPLCHARLFAGQENSGKLVVQVKQCARLLATERGADLLLVDGPPGIGCPVIATMTGADLALLVVEPGVSGFHDLERILAATRHFRVPAVACLNKADISPAHTSEVEALCAAEGVPVVGHIPFDMVVTEAMVQRRPVTAYCQGPVSQALRALWHTLQGRPEGMEGQL